VIVAIRDREMVVRLPDYGRALKWAQMESRSYRLPAGFAENAPLDREPDQEPANEGERRLVSAAPPTR